jgi:WD40 repeat protein
VNGVDRSPDGNVVATADDLGLVKLFKYPCPERNSSFNKYTGHSSHVTNCMFTRNKSGQKFLVTTGGNDKCIFQWKYFPTEEEADADDDSDVEDLSGCAPIIKLTEEVVEEKPQKVAGDNEFEEEEEDEGDQALAVS